MQQPFTHIFSRFFLELHIQYSIANTSFGISVAYIHSLLSVTTVNTKILCRYIVPSPNKLDSSCVTGNGIMSASSSGQLADQENISIYLESHK